MHTLTLTTDSHAAALEGFLAAVEATDGGAVPLWARLARLALDHGWPDSDGWTPAQTRATIARAAGMADEVGAPAGHRLTLEGGSPDGWTPGPGLSYETVTGTTIAAAPTGDRMVVDGGISLDWSLTVSGPGALSVVRRAVAAGRAMRIAVDVPADLAAEAEREAAERGARIGESRARGMVAEAQGFGRRYSAEAEVEA